MVLNKTCLVALLTSLLVGCGGGGETITEPVAIASQASSLQKPQYSLTTNLSLVNYPNSYSTTSTNLLTSSDPCNLDITSLQYSKEWLGAFDLPKINNAPLKKAIVRGMSLKDIMLHDNPAFILDKGCAGNLQAEVNKTFMRLKALGVETVAIPQWHYLSKNANGSWYIVKAEDTFGPLNDNDLSMMVKTAHSFGMQVILYNQIQTMVDGPNQPLYSPQHNAVNYLKWFEAYTPFINERAKVYQSMGIDIWEFGCGGCVYGNTGNGSPDAIALFKNEYNKLITNVKQSYSGKLSMQISDLLFENSYIFQNIDIISIPSWDLKLTTDQHNNLTVALYKALLKERVFNHNFTYWSSLGKTLSIDFGIQSRADALINPGYVEETGCTAYVGDMNAGNNSICIQKNIKPDFSIQAIMYQATFETVNELPVSNIMLFSRDYWMTDVMTPYTAYPNIASSIRNKPAESILKMWYSK